MRRVQVRWLDSFAAYGWQDMAAISPSRIITVGILVDDNSERMVIAGSVSDSGNYHGLVAIPKPCIEEVETIGDIPVPDLDED